jgi:acetyltransferase
LIVIERLATSHQAQPHLPGLSALLRDGVESGASIGFLPPISEQTALAYWQDLLPDLDQGHRILLIATIADELAGTVQLELARKENALHRAELQKLIVHTRFRNQGLGRALLAAAETAAQQANRTLIVLDTRQGDAAEQLYLKHGYLAAGVIPQYARGADGTLDATVFMYRIV